MLPGTTFGPERILEVLWGRKLLIAFFVAVGAAGAYGVARWLPDEYRSEALIMVVPQRIPRKLRQGYRDGKGRRPSIELERAHDEPVQIGADYC